MTKERNKLFQELASKPQTKENINVYHCIPTSQHKVQKSPKSIGVATFETYDPPRKGPLAWYKILDKNTAIMVPSKFNEKIFSNEPLTKPIYYVPHCVDMSKYRPDIEPLEKRPRFTFLFFGSWKERKNYSALIEAYLKEFTYKDDVELLIKTTMSGSAKQFIKNFAARYGIDLKKCAPIKFEDRVFDEEQLPAFMRSVDCLVSPTTGEGFGLPGLQCMAVGTPVITTRFSGVLDYANDDTAILIDPKGFEFKRMVDHVPQFENKKWAFLSAKDIGDKMRYAYNSRNTVFPIMTAKARDYVSSRFSYSEVVKKFDNMIEYVINA